jgi:asparagine synthetase A
LELRCPLAPQPPHAYSRKGEPDLYLIVISERLATGPEGEKRNEEYTAWKKKSETQMQKESGDRLQIREIGSSSLLQELKFRK